MGKLHKLRRAILKDPMAWVSDRHGQPMAAVRYGNRPWEPRSSWCVKSYVRFVKKVLADIESK